MPADPLYRALGYLRTAAAALAVATLLFLLLHVSLIASFRAALVLLAALELLAFGRSALSTGARGALYGEILLKLVVLAVAYLAVGSL